jgi:tol-pal system protein YbgF
VSRAQLGRNFDAGTEKADRMSIKRALNAAFAAGVALCLATSVAAQTPTMVTAEDLAKRDKAMRDRIDRLDKVVRNLREVIVQSKQTGEPVEVRLVSDPDPEMVSLRRRLDDVEASLSTINGRLDDLNRDVELTRRTLTEEVAARREQTEAGAKLAARVQALEAAAQAQVEAAAAAPPPEAGAPPPAATADEAFAQGKQLLLANNYSAAAATFQDFVERFPDSAQAPEARYWLGETLFVQEAYADAATAYIGAIRGWPKTRWAPNATVKLARALIALEKPADACSTLAEFKRRYPTAPGQVAAAAAEARTEAACR